MQPTSPPSAPRTARRFRWTLGLGVGLVISMIATSVASSHREAPLIMEDPVADNTDLYAFRDPVRPGRVTLISNFVPFQEPGGGPNYFRFGEDVRYAIHVDNDGDAVQDITYEFRFHNAIQNPDTYSYATGPITQLRDRDYNFRQVVRVFEVRDGKRRELTDRPITLPPSNTGPRAIPDYGTLANRATRTVDRNKRVFAGQREEGFFADIASVFDVGGLRPFNAAHAIPLPTADGVDTFAGYNVHSVAIQVPIHELTDGDPVIGVWSTASRRATRVFPRGNSAAPRHSGAWTQVSRLGNPLVNEVVVPLEFKDVFNTLRPRQDLNVFPTLSAPDAEGNGSTVGPIPLVTDPILAEQITQLYGVAVPPPPRTDLVSVFLTGIDGLNQPRNVRPSEMLRLNTSIPPTAPGDSGYSPLGVVGGDLAGWPNGRRVGDDVVDTALRAVAGGYALTPDFDVSPNNALTDGVQQNDAPYLDRFPYLGLPHQGYDIDNPQRVSDGS